MKWGRVGKMGHRLFLKKILRKILGIRIIKAGLVFTVIDWEKNRKTFFDFLSSGLGINVSLFRLRQFGKVGSELGSPVAGVEIGTG